MKYDCNYDWACYQHHWLELSKLLLVDEQMVEVQSSPVSILIA